jgi:succinoglycan biosynthesis protein ExoU
MSRQFSVIIAAYNAEATLARAVNSALEQPETAEVIVVDDASIDGTCDHVHKLSSHDPRVRLLRLDVNGGPARARNRGIDAARSPWIALLDADDFFLPDRLSRFARLAEHDFAADDIAFVSAEKADMVDPALFDVADQATPLTTASFATGNMSGRHKRGEMGFLKPVMSRAFLERHQLRYDESMRLGEDVDLYLRALLAGARFLLLRQVGYCAVVRPTSLSAAHGAADLAALHDALVRNAKRAAEGSTDRTAILTLAAQVRQRRDHRLFLDRKAVAGLLAALRFAFSTRGRAGPIVRDVLRDKLRLGPAHVIGRDADFRTLLTGHDINLTSSSGGSVAGSESTSSGRSSTVTRSVSGK